MIECKINKGKLEMSAIGDTNELIADICVIVKSLYEKLDSNDKTCAEWFRFNISNMLSKDCVCWKDVDELRDELDKAKVDKDDKIKRMTETIENLEKALNELERGLDE